MLKPIWEEIPGGCFPLTGIFWKAYGKTVMTKNPVYDRMKNKLIEAVEINDSVMDDVALINVKRIFYIAIIAMPISLVVIGIFLADIMSGSKDALLWQKGIVFCHIGLLIAMAALVSFAYLIRKAEAPNKTMRWLPNIAVTVILLIGIIIVAVDQLVTSNITPFLVACTITGGFFLIRPYIGFILYFVTYWIFYFAVGLTQGNADILLSNRVNGLTSVGMGICLALILWNTNVSGIMQKRCILKQQKELAEKNRELAYLAFYDPLTDLYNRRSVKDLLDQEMEAIKQDGHSSSIVILDIDDFKNINDHFGHPAGDLAIQEVAKILKKNLADTGAVARWGGEEFFILLPHTTVRDAEMIAERMRKAICKNVLFIKDKEIRITASFGVAPLTGVEKDDLDVAYKKADQALYLVKEKGKNHVGVVDLDA